jgi:hypothetical protein
VKIAVKKQYQFNKGFKPLEWDSIVLSKTPTRLAVGYGVGEKAKLNLKTFQISSKVI